MRMAIGAQASDILRLVVRQGGVPVIAGLLIGLAGTIALTRYLTSLLYGVQPGDPLTLVWVSLALLASAALAIAIPARRAAQVDPMIALREE